MGNEIPLALIGLLGAQAGLIAWVVKKTIIDAGKDLKEHTKSAVELKSAVTSFESYLRERNGRDNEQHTANIKIQKQMIASVEKLPNTMQAIADNTAAKIMKQEVVTQNVEHQTVNSKE